MVIISNIPEIKELKEFLYNDKNEIQTKKIVYKWVKNQCPKLIEYYDLNFKNQFREFIYCILNGINEIPICPVCNKPLPLRNFKIGFQKTCSKECTKKLLTNNKEFANKISNALKNKHSKQAKWLYNYNFESIPNYTIIKQYCPHGDIKVYNKVLYKMHDINEGTFCIKCNENIFKKYAPSDIEINNFINEFPNFYKHNRHALNYEFWIRYYPKKLKILITYFEMHIRPYNNENDLPEVYYVALNKLIELPKCPICGKYITLFHNSSRCYATHCNEHLYTINNSTGERDLTNFIKSLGLNSKINRNILSGKEIDCYIEEKQIGFEYNGCYFHSNACKEKNYHFNKKIQAEQKNIDLYFIWEDDWLNKQEIIKSLIKSKLGLFNKKIGARKCILKEIGYSECSEFLNNNHLHGYTAASIKLGLFYNKELVAVMTFGKSRFKKDEMEIIRFANKLNYQVIGGASKLFKYFKEKYLGNKKCVSFAFNDISNGNMYKKLGFNKENNTENWTWLYNGIRYHRLNKIKNNNNLLKCYSSGVTKYSFQN